MSLRGKRSLNVITVGEAAPLHDDPEVAYRFPHNVVFCMSRRASALPVVVVPRL